MTTTSVVLIVLRKKIFFSHFCQHTRNAVGYASPKPNKFKKVIEVFQQMKNDHYPIETTYSKNNIPHTPILRIITKISKFYPQCFVELFL